MSVWHQCEHAFNFSLRKDHCDPSLNRILALTHEPAPTTMAIAVLSRQMECLAGARDVLLMVFADGGVEDSSTVGVLSAVLAEPLAGLISLSCWYNVCWHICGHSC